MMASLRTLQELFATQLLSSSVDGDFLATINSCSSAEASTRLHVYRNNVMSSLVQALGDTYPVIKRLIGADCFKCVATDFIRRYPPNQASLHCYGDSFPAFIKTHPACLQLEYLSDVAQLEWNYQCAFHASDDDVISLSDLQTIDVEQVGDLFLTAHPSVFLLSSLWPIDIIWHENCQDQPITIDLSNQRAARLLIFRHELKVTVINLEQQLFLFLKNIINRHSLEQAWIMTGQPIEALGTQLSYLLSLPLFSHYQLRLK